jgi:hypothetical protein
MSSQEDSVRRVTITQFTYQPAIKDFTGTVVGVIDVDEHGVRLRHGGEGWLETRVMDFERGVSVGAGDDPLRWAELLPGALGTGNTEVSVEEVAPAAPIEDRAEVASSALAALSAAVHSR